jgi:nitrite reductase (NADH) large subunit
MERHVAAYADEWRETLEDPERLRRLVSLINAPGDPGTRASPSKRNVTRSNRFS